MTISKNMHRPKKGNLDWQKEGLCASRPLVMNQTEWTAFWYPESRLGLDLCKDFCSGCPVRGVCLEYALDNHEFGVWGGTSERERQRMHRARNRNRVLA